MEDFLLKSQSAKYKKGMELVPEISQDAKFMMMQKQIGGYCKKTALPTILEQIKKLIDSSFVKKSHCWTLGFEK